MFTSKSLPKAVSTQSGPQNLVKTKSVTSIHPQVAIERTNPITDNPEVLYYTPATEGKLFHPCEWTINDFQIGRHLGKGK